MSKPSVSRAENVPSEKYSWGRLEWFVSGELGNSETLTVGRCLIDPGEANQPHYHPNCDEVLHVVEGEIRHRLGDDYVEMSTGDTVSIPAGLVHCAENVGPDGAVLLITFSSPHRQVVGTE